MEDLTPMLKQYLGIKKKHGDCILFFRLGDFYEMFFDDAKIASNILDLVLTSREAGKSGRIPMCGIPFHAADSYISRLIKNGYKVAICEQTEDPSKAKGIVKREVVRIITTGTYVDESSDSRCIVSIVPDNNHIGIAIMDNSTGQIKANEFSSKQNLSGIIARIPVYEVICPESSKDFVKNLLNDATRKNEGIIINSENDWKFDYETAKRNICGHFRIESLAGTGIGEKKLAICASGGLLEYVKTLSRSSMTHIDRISLYDDSEYLFISPSAIRGLEMESLIKSIDRTITAPGKRQIKEWIFHPLKDIEKINERFSAVGILMENKSVQQALTSILKKINDIDKALSRISSGYSNPRNLLALKNSIGLIPELKKELESISKLNKYFQVEDIPDLREFLENAINPDIPLSNPEGEIIKDGFNRELDEYRSIKKTSNQWLKNYQAEQIKKTGISSLKIGYTQVFGYYIEISKANLHLVPETYIRKQTLVNAERFITPELKEFEEKMLSAQQRIIEIESELMKQVTSKILEFSNQIHQFTDTLAAIDVLNSFSIIAKEQQYIKPEINGGDEIIIKDGKHPVVELYLEDDFIPNDTLIDCSSNRLLVITGPNMAGKSTYIRQVAILIILAQSGCYIPASSATIGLVDKVFARIGAHDEISKGQSTFMVEMTETAYILSNLSKRSLVILDEIGRGTSTYDGLALAWAVVEYLYKQKIRTLFATHFHELVELEKKHPGIKNYNVAVKQWQDEIIFLHKIIPGGTDESYGIYVAKLAGIPEEIINRSKEILTELESLEKFSSRKDEIQQLDLFTYHTDPLLEKLKNEIQEINPDNITPLDALKKIVEWKNLINKK
ncbi:MAG TPA: DNA mismatch repair protein MutS [Candidatus Ratteibacteria bacterium]|nr:DNA mismatch repair protein MutS [bacterium]HRS06715.1 DNA mismatch repair protein MutS [Candidatus Ratteibacteria bacterium]